VTRFIAKRTIDKLLAQGANVVLTSGQVRKIPLESFDADARISLHLDAMKASAVERHKTQAMDVYAYPKDKQDKILGENIMFEFHNDSTLGDITEPEDMDSFKIDWNPKDGAMGWNIDAKPELEVGDTLRTRLIYNKQLQALRGTNKRASSVPAVLIEMCRMADTPKLKSLIMGEYGEAVVNSIVDGIERYLENEK
jgi:N-acetylmuramoyl-L-alanine amidase